MNRRELAKNGFLGLCGFLIAKILPKEPKENIRIAFSGGTESSAVATCYIGKADGEWKRVGSWEFLSDSEEDGYTGNDGVRIIHG